MAGKRFELYDWLGNRNWIATRLTEDASAFVVINEGNSVVDTLRADDVFEKPEVPYGPLQKGDFIQVQEDTTEWEYPVYLYLGLVAGVPTMRLAGADFPLPPLDKVTVIRRFQVGFNIAIGPNRCLITAIEDTGTEYLSIELAGTVTHHVINEYCSPFG